MHEIYWNDVSSVEAADPPRRQPLGEARTCLDSCHLQGRQQGGTPSSGASKGLSGLLIQVHELAANPDALLRTLAHYLQHPGERAELGTDSALETVSGLGPDTPGRSATA